MKKLDIVFVHSNASDKIYQGLSSNHSAIETPIWAGMLANHVRSRGFSTAIVDAEAERYYVKDTVSAIHDVNPRIACFVVYGQQPSASTQNMEGAVSTAKELRRLHPEIKILFVGAHVAALPEETLQTEECIDFVCLNEGAYTISNLCQVEDFETSTLKKVKGLIFRDGKEVITNEPERIVPKNLLQTDLPGIAWDLLPDFSKYRTAGWHSWSNGSEKSPFASVYTSLGCPYKCSFCMINIINRTKAGPGVSSQDSNVFRWWEPEFMIKQFDHLAERGVKNIKIADELFVLNPNHFMKLCNLIIERKYNFNIWAYSRIDTCKPEFLETLKKAGVNWLALGIENPDSVLRHEIHKGSFKEVRIGDIIDTIRNADINVISNYIFGLPMDTQESMENTLKYAKEHLTEAYNFYCAMAYPGSPLYLLAKERGWTLPQTYSGYSQHSYDILNLRNDNLSSKEILQFRDRAWNEVHTNPSYITLLKQKFGNPAVQNLEESTKIRLSRKLLGD